MVCMKLGEVPVAGMLAMLHACFISLLKFNLMQRNAQEYTCCILATTENKALGKKNHKSPRQIKMHFNSCFV